MIRKKKTKKSKLFKSYNGPVLQELLISGGVGVLATDTLYGLVASALSKEAVETVYALKGRKKNKPPIILISDASQLDLFGVEPKQKQRAAKYWPGKVSVILKCELPEFEYLHRGKKSLAFRLPDKPILVKLLEQTGPLIAPSANPEGEAPAQTFQEAKEYFDDNVDFYVDTGQLAGRASKIISLLEATPRILRP